MIVTLCGSTKFKDTFMEVAQKLTLEEYIILMPNVFHHKDMPNLTEEQKEKLDILHKQKIDMSNAIVVIDNDDYIGKSTRSEIEYAARQQKPIFYWSEIKECYK